MSVKETNIQTGEKLRTNFTSTCSKFTFKDLLDLNDPKLSYQSPLSVISLIDLNAFFAQVEQLRLNLPVEAPVVCVQWQSLIAVSYAARKFGISRMDTVQSAKKKCPDLVCAHAAVFKKGESHWSYVEGFPYQGTHKVSLDPYRRESRKIIKVLHQHCDLVEKASVDESYLDLGRLVYEKITSLFPECRNGSGSEYLPKLPPELPDVLQWKGVVIPSAVEDSKSREDEILSTSQRRNEGPEINDWDDVCMLIGSMVILDIRKALYDAMGYTTSAGIANNKLVAKLAAGFKKPDNQTVIRNSSTLNFLNNFKLTDVTGMGGKIGDLAMQKLRVPPDQNSFQYIRENVTLEMLEDEYHDDLPLAKKIFNIVRGIHKSSLVHREAVKSMMSRKNFIQKIPVETLGDAFSWIKVFAGDLYNRMIELDEENLRLSMSQEVVKVKGILKRPKTIAIHFSSYNGTKHSKQAPLVQFRSLERLWEHFEMTGTRLLKEVLESSSNFPALNRGKSLKELEESKVSAYKIKIIPLANLSLTISNFVKNSDSSSIESYAGRRKEDKQDQDSIKKMFEEVNNTAPNMEQEIPQQINRDLSSDDKHYISKLFSDFNSENIIESPKEDKLTRDSKRAKKDTSKEDAEYIKKLFDNFNNENRLQKPTGKNKSKSPTLDSTKTNKRRIQPDVTPKQSISTQSKKQKVDIFQSLVSHKKKETKDTSLLEELIQNHFCPKCNMDISDAIEHNDFHYALELSDKINSST
ncbi:DNA polymerase eta subunit [Scheffersomyces xylosifermentans]|uniref:DNA polymerase eta subunit n=1 Tax=Scheffersomyces xylosifermentans TaxID=1304137 RepID=UPI00315D0A34